MSSIYVREQVMDFIEDNLPGETLVDLTSDFQELKELLADNGLQPDAPWLGIDFIGADEEPASLAANGETGCYRETGAFQIHICTIARLGNGNSILTRGEAVRNLFRGKNINGVIIESMTLVNTNAGATLQFEGGYMSGTFIVSYIRDLNL